MNNHPAFEKDLEKTLAEDQDGSFLHELQRSLASYGAAIEGHMSAGLSSEEFTRWKNLQRAVEAASEVSRKIREELLDA